jgi:hypothetical protein
VDLKGWGRAVTAFLMVFLAILAGASWVVRDRERSCAESCNLKGYATYRYEGCSGAGRLLRADRCTCMNAAGSPY